MTTDAPDASDAVESGEAGGSDGPPSAALAVERRERHRPHIPAWQETLILLVVAVVLAVVIKAFFAQAFYIPSGSMEPGLVKNDRILVQKVSYWGGSGPDRGDVVVFKDPGGWLSAEEDAGPTNPVSKLLAKVGLFPSGGHLVKRVIGVAGDIITCCDANGRLSVNGHAVDETGYIKHEQDEPCAGPYTGDCHWSVGPVPEGHVFVMGDNRMHSSDSTAHMCVQSETDCVPGHEFVSDDLIVGKVFALVWPLSHFHGIGDPDALQDVPAPQ